MSPEIATWIETAGDMLLAVCGGFLGKWFSRRGSPYWTIGYFMAIGLFAIYALAVHCPRFSSAPPISFLMAGRNRFALAGFMSALVFVTPLSRLVNRRERIAVFILMVFAVGETSVYPFLAPAFNRQFLLAIKTRIDSDGVCLQSSNYSCGPAAAVTGLRRLGFAADEGQIAIRAHTSEAIGTPPDILAGTLQELYGREGLICEYRYFNDLNELKQAGVTLAILKFNFMADHYVTVMEVGDHSLVLGDPLLGITRCSREEFEKKWRFVGIVLRRAYFK